MGRFLFSLRRIFPRVGPLLTGLLAVCATVYPPEVRAGFEIAGSTSYVLPGAPARTAELASAPVPLADGGTAYVAKLEGTGEHVLMINRPSGLAIIRPSDLGLPGGGGSPFIRLASNGAEVLFAAYNSSSPNGIGLYRADPAGPILLVADPVSATGQYRYSWQVREWTARNGVFAMLSQVPLGRVGFAPMSTTLSLYRAGTMTPLAVAQSGTSAFAGFSHLALSPDGARVYFRGVIDVAYPLGAPATFEAGIYAWENGALQTILDPQTQLAGGRISVAGFAISDDQAIAFLDSGRNSIALLAGNRITELVAHGAHAIDGTPIELDGARSQPRVLRIDGQHVYFIAPRHLLNPWGEEGVRDDLIFRVPRGGGPAEVFFNPARVFGDATRISTWISDLALSGDAPQLTFQVREIWGTQQAIYRAAPPFGQISFPAVPPGFPSVILQAGWPDGFYHRAGERATVEAQADGPGPFTFDWFFNGQRVTANDTPYARAVEGTLTLFPFAQTYHSGDYTVAVTNAAGTSVASAPVLVGADTGLDGGTPPALVNYSVRGFSTAAEGVFTAGFSLLPPIEVSYNPYQEITPVSGTSQRLLLRAVGPGLAPFARDDVVPAPATQLELYSGSQVIGRNDGAWSADPAVAPAAATVGAFPLDPGSRDSALLTTLTPQSYTAQAAVPAGDGTVLLECYVVQGRGNLRNLSARGLVADVEPRSLTLGFVINGAGARPVLLRAVGPGLQSFGVGNAASRPRLELYSADNTLIAQNSGHDSAPNLAQLVDASRQLGAFPLPSGSADAAILLHLPEGAYVARVSATAGSPGGVALIELYTNVGYERRN